MLRSLYSGISGMRAFQTKLDVIGNNISNVNTVGYKTSRGMFKEILTQTIAGISAPVEGVRGGVNAKQIGLGISLGSIDTLHTPGSAMTTNVSTDLRVDGDGFFAVRSSEDQEIPYLTRAGNFTLDGNRQLVTSDGMFVQAVGGGNIVLGPEVSSFSIGLDGSINAVSADGTSTPTGLQIGIVKVANPGGLERIGGNMYRYNVNADLAGITVSPANSAEIGTGAIVAGQLEMSNVELTSEFSEMIVSQRGLQSNARIITTSDEVLQEIVNLRR
ncbi:MAG: flagellar hook-basal body complex protein [Paenibacillaceae bacterium]|nr:flagellar hook-basal body complex protein [Paenibacillaceae bacterium]